MNLAAKKKSSRSFRIKQHSAHRKFYKKFRNLYKVMSHIHERKVRNINSNKIFAKYYMFYAKKKMKMCRKKF